MSCLGLDIGGANIKFSDGIERTDAVPFELWKFPDRLADTLRGIIASMSGCSVLGVTMTGELADCFPSKAAGVRHILTSVCQARDELPTRVYLVDGRWADPESALAKPMLAAASNWHVLARLAGRYVSAGDALLLDIGSTTCDLIPLIHGQPAAAGQTDTQRMLAGELVYTGVERSPVCAVVGQVPYRGRTCTVAQELFATMRDVYLELGELPEQPDDLQTADGRPATRTAARARLARVICADETEFDEQDAAGLAAAAADAQADLVCAALNRVMQRIPHGPAVAAEGRHATEVVLSGHGDFLARRVLQKLGHRGQVISLSERLGPAASRAATAYALATLLREEFSR